VSRAPGPADDWERCASLTPRGRIRVVSMLLSQTLAVGGLHPDSREELLRALELVSNASTREKVAEAVRELEETT
jgi:hypothetical protein